MMDKRTRTVLSHGLRVAAIAAVILALAAGSLFAERRKAEAPAEEPVKETVKEKVNNLGVSGVMYMEYANLSGYQFSGTGDVPKVWRASSWTLTGTSLAAPTGAIQNRQSSLTSNTFRLTRVYLTYAKDINEIFSVKITTDFASWNADKGDLLFLKFAYMQAKKDFGPVGLVLQLGKVGTPVSGYIDAISDYRWITENNLSGSAKMLNGNGFETTADLGGSLSVDFFKIVKLSYLLSNGEGFRYNNAETYKGKAQTFLVNIAPIKQLHFNLYGRMEDTNKARLNASTSTTTWTTGGIYYTNFAYRTYEGAGIVVNTDFIKAGSNFFLLRKMSQGSATFTNAAGITAAAPKSKKNFVLSDSYVNMNLGALVPAAPVLMMGRFAYGKEFGAWTANYRKATTTITKCIGLGWQFNSNVRVAGYYENITYSIKQTKGGMYLSNQFTDTRPSYFAYNKNPDPAQNFYIKVEAKY